MTMDTDAFARERGAAGRPGSSLAYRTGSWRDHRPVHLHGRAPCHTHCPAGEDGQAWIQKLQERDPRGAFETILRANPLPATTGRICPHPCEDGCNRGRFDQPVAIHALERHVGDLAIENGWRIDLPELTGDGPVVGILGAGPAGLSAAWRLRRAGIRSVIYDRSPLAGGLLRTAIPLYRLPREVLDAELVRLFEAGIEFRPHVQLGRDIHLDDLERTYDAVILTPGLHAPRPWSVIGAVPGDLHTGLALLEEWIDVGAAPLDGRVVVVHGGGNTAVDVARMAIRAGAREVHLVTTRALPGSPDAVGPEDVMQAFPREIAQAVEEGVIVHPHTTVSRLVIRGGRVEAVELASVRAFRDADGRTRRVAFEGTERVLLADVVVPATGEVVDRTGLEALPRAGDHLASGPDGSVPGRPKLFLAGDAAGRGGSISAAVGDGARAAEAVLRLLARPVETDPRAPEPVEIARLNLRYFDHRPRNEPPVLPVPERLAGEREIEQGLEPAAAADEAARCLSCGNCLACDNCWVFCPDFAVLKTQELASDGSHYVFDYDFCKGCGVCAAECPTGYIAMVEERPTASPAASGGSR